MCFAAAADLHAREVLLQTTVLCIWGMMAALDNFMGRPQLTGAAIGRDDTLVCTSFASLLDIRMRVKNSL